MLITILDFSVAPESRAAVLAQLGASAAAIRAMAGNQNFRAFASQEDAAGITVLHEWTDRASFDAYLASDIFTQFGQALRPLMTAAPSSRRFEASLLEKVA